MHNASYSHGIFKSMITKERALDAIEHEKHLAEIYQLETECIDTILDFAMGCFIPAFRWMNYEILKKYVAQFVGSQAQHPELRTNRHHEVLLGYIDWLLPSEVIA